MTDATYHHKFNPESIIDEFSLNGGKLTINYLTTICTYYPPKKEFSLLDKSTGKPIEAYANKIDELLFEISPYYYDVTKSIPSTIIHKNIHRYQDPNIEKLEIEFESGPGFQCRPLKYDKTSICHLK